MFLCLSNALTTAKNYKNRYLEVSGVASPRFFGGTNMLTSSEQQYFVWDTACQSTKRQDMQKKFGGYGPLAPLWLRLCLKQSCLRLTLLVPIVI